jgi:hypothetical protein
MPCVDCKKEIDGTFIRRCNDCNAKRENEMNDLFGIEGHKSIKTLLNKAIIDMYCKMVLRNNNPFP